MSVIGEMRLCLRAAYKNEKGELCRTSFHPGDLPALKAENKKAM